MKAIFSTLALFALLSIPALAQPQTLLDGAVEHGGFGGVTAQATELNDKLGLLVGGGGGWILNHSVAIGGAGYGLTTEIPVTDASLSTPKYLDMGYGGVYLGYVHNSNDLVHFSVNTLVGAGAMQLNDAPPSESWGKTNNSGPSDGFFVVEPGVNAELNVASYFRVALGGSYRFVTGVDKMPGLSNSSVSGPSANLTFKFGSF